VLDLVRAWLFPPACAGCGARGPALCARCAPTLHDAIDFEVDGVQAFALGGYEGALRRAIVALKHGERDPLDVLAELLAARAPVIGTLVPLPTSRGRSDARGFDQSVELVRRIARRRSLPHAELLRKRGAPQDGRSRLARLRAAGRFRLERGVALPRTATLLDDVCTTGATVRDAMHTLAGAGVAVRRLVFVARTAPDRRDGPAPMGNQP
jgi:predicted amidophosphoribosyltransferase